MTDPLPPSAFDLVVSVAMAHHASLERLLPQLVAAVAPGGTLLIQDVTTRRGVRHLPVNALAWLVRHLRLAAGADRRRKTVATLYEAHGDGEVYLTASDVATMYHALLPSVRVYLHVGWRYTAIWHPEKATEVTGGAC